MRRDSTSLANDGSMRRAITFGILPLLGESVISAGAAATGATTTGIDTGKLQQPLATSFARRSRMQGQEVNRFLDVDANGRPVAHGDGPNEANRFVVQAPVRR